LIDALDIDDDDSVEVIEVVERAFGITISDAEAAACQTVGDLFALVCAKVPTVERGGQMPCLTASAFRSLRRAIRERRSNLDLRPETPISSFVEGRDHRAWHAYLTDATRLRIPRPTLSPLSFLLGLAGFCLAAAGVIAVTGSGILSVLFIGLLGLAIMKIVGRFGSWSWESPDTLGDLARRSAALSVARAVEANGAVRSREAWQVLLTLLHPFANRTGNIGPATRFFAKPF
jgi:hypothetical protein